MLAPLLRIEEGIEERIGEKGVPDESAAVLVEGLVKSFDPKKPPALKNLTARIEGGRITGLVGPDGAGKTTLLRLLCGLLLPDEGRISVLGLDAVTQAEAVHARVGYMPQKFGLYEDLTVMENMTLQADLRGVSPKDRESRYGELLDFTGLGPFRKRLAGRLSGGMKQKLGLACTLLARPPALFLDEPGVGVDPVARRELWRMLRDLLTPRRIIVWSTAYLDEAGACDSVLLLNEGELLFDGPPGDLSMRAKGRVFLIDGGGARRRSLIVPLMEKTQTLDAVVQGGSVRVLTRDGGEEIFSGSGLGAFSEKLSMTLSCRAAAPRFEDAFMDILGGARPGNPAVAEFFDLKPPGEETVRAERLVKRFGAFVAVDDVSFSIRRGEVFGLLGPNGAGKSTTFRMMCGLLAPSSGNCSIVGLDFRVAPGAARSRLGYMAQKFSLYGELSVRQNLDFFSGVYGLRGKARREKTEQVIAAFDLARYLKSPARSLPLGFKQRLALGCAVMHGPDVLFLDEPTSGVDPVTRREFWTCINSVALRGVTVMVTTHFMDEAEYCDRVALVYKGRLAASGSPDDLKAAAADPSNPNPTLEDAFIRLIEEADRGGI
ncbi:MAG: ATP-binding cassette domain-containing protein [Synergistaceae bacterium]|jgi:ABC-2 type transport system ATP-binding protein|nr:ATP-binding cassette domain-containing protein [Synergistaceae bacterium]